MIKGNGIVYNSRYNSNLGKSMSWRNNELSKSDTPGPGAYNFFSDFEGFYKYEKKYGKNKNENENEKDNFEGSENKDESNGNGNEDGEGSDNVGTNN